MYIRSDDIQLHYGTMGSGFPVVLLHPFPAHHEFWTPLGAPLSTRYRLILPDLRAHGLSEVGNGKATMAKHAEDLLRLLDAEQVAKAVFVGVSIGGYILFEFWRRHRERVAALVLSNTRAEPDTEQGRANRMKSIEDARVRGTAPFLDAQIQSLIGESTRRNRPDIAAKARTMMEKLTVDGLVALQQGMAERPDSIPTLQAIDVETLVIAGEEDTLTPLANAKVMQQHVRRARLSVIPKAGHYAAFESPNEFTPVLLQFLNGLRPS
ncbi:MAG: alpha/beta hydrolase [Acidobacteria bacterium]|nr:MAG: alpha/beta hydrolase [Acidobacteriota bacterium]